VAASNKIDFLYTNIGRGHPFYLDGIIEAMVRLGYIKLVRGEKDVFEVSHGISRFGWNIARWLYLNGSSGGVAGSVYESLRADSDYNSPGLAHRLLGRDIRKTYASESTPLVVAHPSIVGILDGRENLIYQHGESAVPRESLVTGASVVFVPTEQAAVAFREVGYNPESVVVSGLCIEPSLVKQAADCFEMRLARLNSNEPLSGAFFSSGAEPIVHARRIAAGALSVAMAGGRVFVFVAEDGRLAEIMTEHFKRNRIDLLIVSSHDPMPRSWPGATLVTFASRREETSLTSRLFPMFDFIVVPPHERSNWALGLGLPTFLLMPTIGPYAALNLQILLEHGVADVLESDAVARELGEMVKQFRQSRRMTDMAKDGWGRFAINGFDGIAEFLNVRFGR